MKTKKMSRLWIGAIALILGLLVVLQIPVAAFSQDLRYGKGMASDKKLPASQMYAGMYGDDLSEAERNALDALAEVSLTYSPVPDSVVKSEYDNDNGVLTILVNTYEYIAQNGEKVIWRPTKVWFNKGAADQKSAELSLKEEGLYHCSFSGMTKSQEFMLDVDFVWEVMIAAEIGDTLTVLPYRVGKDAYEALKPYEEYQEALAAYERYLEYPAKKAAYDEYVKQLAKYEDELEKHEDYETAYDQYKKADDAYKENEDKKNKYAEKLNAYYAYTDSWMEFESLREKYEAYDKTYTQIKNALKVLDSAYIVQTVGTVSSWSLFLAIKGPTATTFLDTLAGKEALTGIPRTLIDEARTASANLTNLLLEYDKILTASYESEFARVSAKFAFYKEHYDALCQNLRIFHTDMKEIYCTNGIPALVEGVGKTAQVQLMVAQTYALYTALDDTVNMDSNWVLKYSAKGQKTMNEILHEVHRLTDTNMASPKTLTMPAEEMTLPDGVMERVEHPGKPDYDDTLTKPLAPSPVPKPTAPPEEVIDPGDAPAQCERPDPVPKPTLTSVERALAEEYRAGNLKQREPSGKDKKLTLTQTVSCRRSFRAVNVVTFYYSDGTKIGEILVEKGLSLDFYADQIPNEKREGDAINSSYVFLGWKVGANRFSTQALCDLDISGDLDIIADYDVTPRRYCVTWEVGSQKQTRYYNYGEIPVCPISTELPKQGEISYVFAEWSSEFLPVHEDVTYRALYEEIRPTYRVTWIYGLNGEHETVTWVPYGYPADASSIPVGIAPDNYDYRFDGWDKPLSSFVSGELTYQANYSAIPIAKHEDNSVCAVEHTLGTVILKPTQNTLQISNALEYASAAGKQLEIVWKGFSVTSFTAEQVRDLIEGRCAEISLIEECREADGAIYYQLEFRTMLYSYDPQLSLDVAVRRPSFDRVTGIVYLVADSSETQIKSKAYANKLAFSMQSGDRVLYHPKYVLQVTDPAGKSDYSSVSVEVVGGDLVNLSSVKCEYGYEVVGAILTYSDNKREQVGTQFVMPADPISVELIVERIVFHITFEVDGQAYKQMDLYFGDPIVPPENPTKAEDDSYTYAFEGWTPQVWSKAVDRSQRNPVFTAVFTAHPKTALAADSYRGTLVIRVVAIGLSGMLLFVGSILCIIHRKRVGPFIRRVIKGFVPFIRRLVKGFIPFIRRCGAWVKTRARSVWSKITKRKQEP